MLSNLEDTPTGRKLFKLLIDIFSRAKMDKPYWLNELLNILLFSKFAAEKGLQNIPVFSTRKELYNYIHSELILNKQMDYFEFGVFEGESISEWLKINPHSRSRFFGFDTFTGLPEDYRYSFRRTIPKGSYSNQGSIPQFSDNRVECIKGLFQDTLPAFLKNYQRNNSSFVVNMDADLYSSTLFVLAQLDSILLPNSIVIFDELFSVNHEFKALIDWSTAFRRKVNLFATTKYYKEVAVIVV